MPLFLEQVAYSTQGWSALVNKPQNRVEAVRPAIEKLGGKIIGAWFAFGDYDVVLVTEFPDNASAAAISMAFAAGGACRDLKTTPLMTVEEGLKALQQAGKCGYQPARSKNT
ncbi:MAG: GYD domain-containing protein [Terriglobia bacterium]